MNTVRMNISLPKETFDELSRQVEPRKRSKFITEATKRLLREQRAKKLAEENKEASAEMARINQEIDGTIADGLD